MSETNATSRVVISVAVRSRLNASNEQPRFQRILSDLARQDPAITIRMDTAGGQAIISGMSELHLKAICDRILLEFPAEVEVDEPQVIYLETIRQKAEADGKCTHFNQYARVRVRLEPGEAGSGFQFVDETTEGEVPPKFVDAVNLGIQEVMRTGVVAGHEMVDLLAVLCGAAYHPEDSNDMVFKIAACMAFQEAARRGSPVILEPVMAVAVVVPEEYMGVVIGGLQGRRGWIEEMEHRERSQVIQAMVPLAETFGYATHLHSSIGGSASCSMHFAHYEPAPLPGESGGYEGVPLTSLKGRGFAAVRLHREDGE